MEIWCPRWEFKSNQQAWKRDENASEAPFMKTPTSSALPLHLVQRLSKWPLSQMSFLPDTCLHFPLVSQSYLLLRGVELFVCGGLFMGEGIPRCSRLPLVFQLITQNMTALLLFGAEMSCFSCPHGESEFSASFSPSWTSLQDSGSIRCAWANATCFGPYTQALYNFCSDVRLHTTGQNVSLSVQIYRIVFFSYP